jgi:hypothetical protein
MACFGKSSTTDDDVLVNRLHDLTLERDALKTEKIASAKEVARLSALVEGQRRRCNQLAAPSHSCSGQAWWC